MNSAHATADPRVERSRHAICEAALAELAEVGYGAMSIESIARRAGVGKATVYRHWRGKLDLIESALEMLKADLVMPEGGTARERIAFLLTWLAGFLADSTLSACLPSIVSAAQHDESMRAFQNRFSKERRLVLIALLDEGVASGELSRPEGCDNSEIAAEALVGPLFFRRLMTDAPFPPDRVGEIVDLVLGPE